MAADRYYVVLCFNSSNEVFTMCVPASDKARAFQCVYPGNGIPFDAFEITKAEYDENRIAFDRKIKKEV